jgi:hypothetical protein
VTACIATLTNPVAGREEEYARWYMDRHLPDILKIPGVMNGQFFEIAQPEGARWRHHAFYEVADGRIPEVLGEIGKRANGPQMPLSDAMDAETVMFLTAASIGPWTTAPGASPAAVEDADCRLLALSNPIAGREADFEAWYDDQHVPDVLRVEGFVGAQRFAIDPTGRRGPPPWSRLCTYAAKRQPPLALLKDIGARAGTDEMPITDALDRASGFTGLFAALTPRLKA